MCVRGDGEGIYGRLVPRLLDRRAFRAHAFPFPSAAPRFACCVSSRTTYSASDKALRAVVLAVKRSLPLVKTTGVVRGGPCPAVVGGNSCSTCHVRPLLSTISPVCLKSEFLLMLPHPLPRVPGWRTMQSERGGSAPTWGDGSTAPGGLLLPSPHLCRFSYRPLSRAAVHGRARSRVGLLPARPRRA